MASESRSREGRRGRAGGHRQEERNSANEDHQTDRAASFGGGKKERELWIDRAPVSYKFKTKNGCTDLYMVSICN